MTKSCYISLCPLPTTRLKNKNVYKNCATLKTKKRRKQKIIFSPQFFFVPKSCGAIIFSCGIISTPLISQIFCVLDKEKELISFFQNNTFKLKKRYTNWSPQQHSKINSVALAQKWWKNKKERNLKNKNSSRNREKTFVHEKKLSV